MIIFEIKNSLLIVCEQDDLFGTVRLSVYFFAGATLCTTVTVESYVVHHQPALCTMVDIRAWLAECSKSTMIYGIQPKVSVCFSLSKGILGQLPIFFI